MEISCELCAGRTLPLPILCLASTFWNAANFGEIMDFVMKYWNAICTRTRSNYKKIISIMTGQNKQVCSTLSFFFLFFRFHFNFLILLFSFANYLKTFLIPKFKILHIANPKNPVVLDFRRCGAEWKRERKKRRAKRRADKNETKKRGRKTSQSEFDVRRTKWKCSGW